ncbi:MAG: TSCPD domain-containing protein [Clostridia bacterium]|nr:TSCPD domain-containing protein [Clostridia bacterium]
MHYECKAENACARRPTSCTDQLAIAVRQAYNELNSL